MNTDAIAALISEVRANINRFLVGELKRHGVEGLVPSHGAILFHLFAKGNVGMKELAAAVRRDKSTVTALVGKLIAHGYVEKTPDSEDQRRVRVALTDKGQAFRPAFEAISRHLLARAWNGIDASEQQEVVRILQKIAANFD